ncbi:hypothetical protein [Pyramidobacter sp. C12-8]|uniref:hypothetical protein n=1 Tax=Pyramidobacter sp. C12-8 TaxID=1943580 RepID=UPI00143B8D38|nr:hypothetical protein [Pyramidobacter sp. C12-8]
MKQGAPRRSGEAKENAPPLRGESQKQNCSAGMKTLAHFSQKLSAQKIFKNFSFGFLRVSVVAFVPAP